MSAIFRRLALPGLLLVSGLGLGGCVVAPAPGIYVRPAPPVYVAPRPYYYPRPHYYGGGYGWRRW